MYGFIATDLVGDLEKMFGSNALLFIPDIWEGSIPSVRIGFDNSSESNLPHIRLKIYSEQLIRNWAKLVSAFNGTELRHFVNDSWPKAGIDTTSILMATFQI